MTIQIEILGFLFCTAEIIVLTSNSQPFILCQCTICLCIATSIINPGICLVNTILIYPILVSTLINNSCIAQHQSIAYIICANPAGIWLSILIVIILTIAATPAICCNLTYCNSSRCICFYDFSIYNLLTN